MNPINLRETFGNNWWIVLDEAADGLWLDPWNYQIACKHGHIYPVGDGLLGAATNRNGDEAPKATQLYTGTGRRSRPGARAAKGPGLDTKFGS